jgi:hypothetical protein
MNRLANSIRSRANALNAALAFAALSAFASMPASAGQFATAITTEIADAKTEATLVAVAVLGLVGFFLLLKMVRRAAH